ncbi:sugar ABC transporter permease [Amycolatopsis acidiphila]|uniref:Sugar ABC transporter permease n=2 Tax=Amycolatopsis acidiphila TaxID=715473 RepID=A0A558AMD3_9PSEU|nr:sugar ABC transporter permease [Amycolatopsis acidiphila]
MAPEQATQSLGARLADRGIDRALLLLIPAVAIVGLLFVYPFVYGVLISFSPENGGAWANYRDFFTDPYQSQTIWYTVRLALPVAAASLLIALPLAYRLRRDFRGKRVITLLFLLPVTLGSVVLSEGLTTIFSPSGWVNLVLGGIGLGPVSVLYSYWGTFVAGVLGIVPLMLLLLIGFFGGIDPALEDAAATLGAGRTVRFWRVTFPLVLPGLVTTLSLALVEAFAIFPSAVLVGEPNASTHVLSIPIYEAAQQRFDYSAASADATIMVLVELLVLGLLTALRTRLYRGAASGGKG